MIDRAFLVSKLGRAALLSIAAMLAMNLVALQDRLQAEAKVTAGADGASQA